MAGFAAPPAGIARVIAYTSPVDRSRQEYGVYLPTSPPYSPAGYPAILHAHGYGWWVGADFSPWQRQWADDHGFILVNANVRGPVFGDSVGDTATQEVIADLVTRFAVDRTRVFYTGGSMGATIALRHGVRHPDLFAAVCGVDGWTDFREWHWHWYAREDARDSIEEFRRPLLEAASPLYSAGRATWGATYTVADGKDNIVFPDNGIRLDNAIADLANDNPAKYEHRLTLGYPYGHCGSYDLPRIYDYFAARVAYPQPGNFRIESNLLAHGCLYWGEMRALQNQGEKAVLDCTVEESAVWVATSNLDSFTLHLAGMPRQEGLNTSGGRAATARSIQPYAAVSEPDGGGIGERILVVVDGTPLTCPLTSVTFEAARDVTGALTGWRIAEPGARRKRPTLEGPIGQAFTQPFVVAYADTPVHRHEAEDFAAGWNAFYVHGAGAQAIPESKLAPADLADRNLILFGSLETSVLLRRAQECQAMPVEVHEGSVVVRDPATGDRAYDGSQFGCFFAYPNPLTDGRTYLVVCTGQFATQADGGGRQGLEYDLEKLPWAYPDYVVFNTDQAQLPRVNNVNNKPPVTCYEAGYFVEAGYFDSNWQPARWLEFERVARQASAPADAIHQPPGSHFQGSRVRVIHVSDCQVQPDPSSPARLLARVTIVGSGGNPVAKARVTGRFSSPPGTPGTAPTAVSGLSGDDGVCVLASPARALGPPGTAAGRPTDFRVLNVAATSATYDYRADVLPGSCFADTVAGLAIRPTDLHPDVTSEDALIMEADVCNLTSTPVIARCWLTAPGVGATGITPGEQAVCLAAGDTHRVSFRWVADAAMPSSVPLVWQAQIGGFPIARARAISRVLPRPRAHVIDVAVGDRTTGDPIAVTATLFGETRQTEHAVVRCVIPEARLMLPERVVSVPPGDAITVTFTPQKGAEALVRGVYHAVVSVVDSPESGNSCEFTVR